MQTICIWNRNSLSCKRPNIPQGGWWCFFCRGCCSKTTAKKYKCAHELNMTSLFCMAKVGLQRSRKLGILYTNPCIDPDQALAESSGRWEQSPFDQTVVMTSSRSSNLPLKSGNSVEVPQGIMSEYVNYSMYAELLKGRICQSPQLSDPTLALNRRFCCVCAKKKLNIKQPQNINSIQW